MARMVGNLAQVCRIGRCRCGNHPAYKRQDKRRAKRIERRNLKENLENA